ncbi:MAG: hypothetical protein N4A57_13140 [Anaeromicrobium sp.]|jgi:translation elongation factor EF-Ts|uniref:hypothetical protein n=1 Tax=Anaeromicrobium sp. TaxID=1929132 RepID=UPI0025D69398|nr:hypothetical protein [Anaeromicrobium sp.]MCT4595196.1 hypothetical protein [Anaeromicrobium sp.]
MITLEKVDMVRERTGCTYKDIKEALEINNGDVLDSIIYLEEKIEIQKQENNIVSKISKKAQDIYNEYEVSDKGKEIINSTRQMAKKGKDRVEQIRDDYHIKDRAKNIADNMMNMGTKIKGKVKKSRIEEIKRESENEIIIYPTKPSNDENL